MARKIYYKILDDGGNQLTDNEWEEISRLQHWYNSEFVWTAGKLALKMFVVFPNFEGRHSTEDELWEHIVSRRRELRSASFNENAIIHRLESEGLIVVKWGGYFDNCLASGFTRVAANEFDAYLVCEFLLKASLIARNAYIIVSDQGEFVKTKIVRFHNGHVSVPLQNEVNLQFYKSAVDNRHVFAVVDAAKYDHFPKFESVISGFNDLPKYERQSILHDWNWLGFERNFDINGDDVTGFDLNKKVASFKLEEGKNIY